MEQLKVTTMKYCANFLLKRIIFSVTACKASIKTHLNCVAKQKEFVCLFVCLLKAFRPGFIDAQTQLNAKSMLQYMWKNNNSSRPCRVLFNEIALPEEANEIFLVNSEYEE